jgi:hypothetical protein
MVRMREISVRGKPVTLPALDVQGVDVIVRDGFVKTAEIFDEYWLERASLPPVDAVLARLRGGGTHADIFTFAQRVPDSAPMHDGHVMEWSNFAVLRIRGYEHWLEQQIPSATRRNVRAAEKRGVSVRACDYDDDYVRGVSAIYDETPIRAGRRYWHYGKDIETVRKENGTYAQRSSYLGAFHQGEMVGYMKIVWDTRTAAIMQIVSKTTAREYRVNNALMAQAVREASARGVEHLIYESFDYGNKAGDSLTRFKQSNGFERMDVPRYFVPLTWKGSMALRLGLHHGIKERIPEPVAARLRNLRSRWYETREPAASV